MKTASIWLSDKWSVRTSALGESEERTIEFDLEKVISEKKENLEVIKTIKEKNDHYTEIVLKKLYQNSIKHLTWKDYNAFLIIIPNARNSK